jgi:ribosomal protein S19
MCRSLWKLNYSDLFIYLKHQRNEERPIITKKRNQPVYNWHINKLLFIYDGKKYIKILIENNRYFTHKFGEFSLPIVMRPNLHKKKSKVTLKKKKK